jgi:hypothetical protein
VSIDTEGDLALVEWVFGAAAGVGSVTFPFIAPDHAT